MSNQPPILTGFLAVFWIAGIVSPLCQDSCHLKLTYEETIYGTGRFPMKSTATTAQCPLVITRKPQVHKDQGLSFKSDHGGALFPDLPVDAILIS